jgi:peptidyl-prolyl cis-trans isomerase SDCCAG10
MANDGTENDNGSQFFVTLGPCLWLEGRHTIFGKVVGNTLYNLSDFGALETSEELN